MAKFTEKAAEGAPGRPTVRGHVSESGRLSLPSEIRRELGLEKGGPVRIDVLDGSIRIRTMSEIKSRIHQMASHSGLRGKASVADFLSWRSEERSAEAKDTRG